MQAGFPLNSKAGVGRAEQVHHLVMDDLDDLLARLDALDHLDADGLGLDPLDEVAGHLEIHIRLQQGQPDLAQGVADIALGDLAQAPQVPEGLLELAAQ